MLNQIVLVGILCENIDFQDKEYFINLAVPRNFKNAEGVYETDFIPCLLKGTIAKNTSEYCEKGDLIGIKGRIERQDGKITVIAEKVTFLNAKQKENEEEK